MNEFRLDKLFHNAQAAIIRLTGNEYLRKREAEMLLRAVLLTIADGALIQGFTIAMADPKGTGFAIMTIESLLPDVKAEPEQPILKITAQGACTCGEQRCDVPFLDEYIVYYHELERVTGLIVAHEGRFVSPARAMRAIRAAELRFKAKYGSALNVFLGKGDD